MILQSSELLKKGRVVLHSTFLYVKLAWQIQSYIQPASKHQILTLAARILPLTGKKNCLESHFSSFNMYISTHPLSYMKREDISFIKTPSK